LPAFHATIATIEKRQIISKFYADKGKRKMNDIENEYWYYKNVYQYLSGVFYQSGVAETDEDERMIIEDIHNETVERLRKSALAIKENEPDLWNSSSEEIFIVKEIGW